MVTNIQLFPTQFLNRLNDQNKNALLATVSQILASVINFIISLAILRESGLVEFGVFTVSFILLWMIRNLSIGTFLSSISAIGPKIKATSQPAYRGFLLAYLFLFTIFTSVVLSVLQGVAHFLDIALIRPDLFLLTIAANALIVGTEFIRRYQIADQRPETALVIDMVRYIIQFFALAYGMLSPLVNVDGSTALWILIGSNLLSFGAGILQYGRVRWRKSFARAVWPKHRMFLRWMLPANILEILQFNMPLLMAAEFVGYQAVALLRAILQLANIINLPSNAFQQFLQSSYARMLISGDRAGIDKLSRYSFFVLIGFIIAMSAVVILSAEKIAQIMSVTYDPVFLRLLLLFLLLNLVMSIRAVYYSLAVALEIPNVIFFAALLSCINAVFSATFFLPIVGIYAIPLIEIGNTLIGIVVIRRMAVRNLSGTINMMPR